MIKNLSQRRRFSERNAKGALLLLQEKLIEEEVI